jgi:chromosome segregation ATPase
MFNSKKIKRLSDENEELKTTIETIHGKEENIKNLNLVLKKMRLEVAELNEEKRTIRESIGQIKNQEESKKIEIVDLSRKIEHLREMKDELQNVVLSYTNKIENIESTIKRNQEDVLRSPKSREEIEQIESNNLSLYQEHSEIEQNLNDALTKTNQLNDEESAILDRKGNLTSDIIKLEGRLKVLNISYEEISNKLRIGIERINFLKTEESRIKNEILKKQNEIFEVEKKLLKLKGEEKALLGKIEDLSSEENSKLNTVRELDSVLAEKEEFKNSLETEHSSLMNDINEKRSLLLQTQEEFDKLSADLKIQSKELFDTEQTLNLKARKLSNINIEILNYEKKYESLKLEVTDLEKARNDLRMKLQSDKESLDKFTEQNRKLLELVPLLEKRKEEMEQGNAELEERFTLMFQKLNHELNQINRKRSILEQIVLRKEKDVDEKDQLLFEKIAALEESEHILNMRQVEIESFENQIAGLKEQKYVLSNELNKIDEETSERKNYFSDIRLETELLMNKKITIEKSLQDLLAFMNESYGKSKERNSKFEKELVYYEDQLQGYRTKISDSLKELDEIKTSIGSLKIDREEYKGNLDKLSTLKKKLQEEIFKHQVVLQRYQKMREKLKLEQTTGKTFDEIPPKGKSGQLKEMKSPQIYNI